MYEFISTGDFCSTAELLYSEEQIPLNAATSLLHNFIKEMRDANTREQLDDLLDESTSNGQVNSQIVNVSFWDITRVIRPEDHDDLISEFIIDELLRKRITQLTALRQGLDISGVLSHIVLRRELLKQLFTPVKELTPQAIF